MNPNLSINRLINVQEVLAPAAAQAQNLSTLLVLGSTDVIDVVERLRTYTSLSEVAADFGTSGPEYSSAQLYFDQAPQPAQIMIGRWAKTATKGKLNCAPLTTANSLMSAWTAITTGAFKVSIDGVLQSLTGLNFSAATNLNGIATIINGTLTGAVCKYNSVFNRFEIESASTGTTSSVSFLTAGASGVDISAMLNGISGTSGAYVANGIAAESALAAAQIFDINFGQQWYALMIPEGVDNDHLAVAPFIEGTTNKHIYGVTTQEAGVLSSVSTTDIAYLLQQLNLNRTFTQYSSSSAYAVASAFGRILTVDYNGNNTTITLMYKQEPGVVAEALNETQMDALEGKNCNVFVGYNNNTAILERGTVASGNFLDTITGVDWLSVMIMTAVYNLLFLSPTKIPQTDAGMHLIATTIESICSQGVINGLLAPGVWNSQGFGILVQGGYLAKGFYVYAPPVANQTVADRAARKSVLMQVAAKLAGAVHTVDVVININN